MDTNTTQRASWQPPTGYIPVASKVDGITVFGPRPVESRAAEPKTFSCPQCGAALAYDVSAGGVACEHCGYVAPTQSAAPAEHYEFTFEALAAGAQGWGVSRRQLHCDTCGADLTLADGALSTTCPFCASPHVNVRAAAGDQLRPGGLAPFTVAVGTARPLVQGWLGRGWFHPDGLAGAARLDSLTGVYLPFWLFGARLQAPWKAEVGYPETETYLDPSDMKRKTREVIRWRWESGHATVDVADLPVAGTSRVDAGVLHDIEPFKLDLVQTFSPDFLAGWQAQAYDVALPKAWEGGKATCREQAEAACRAQIHSGHVRNLHVTVDFEDETWRYVLLPVYLSAYRFEGKVYQVMVNGQTGAVAGQKPVAWNKVWVVVALMLAPGVFLSLIGLPLLLVGGLGLIPLFIGLVLFVAGVVGALILYSRVSRNERGVEKSQ